MARWRPYFRQFEEVKWDEVDGKKLTDNPLWICCGSAPSIRVQAEALMIRESRVPRITQGEQWEDRMDQGAFEHALAENRNDAEGLLTKRHFLKNR